MSIEVVHTSVAAASLGLLTCGAWLAWGPGYAALVLGAVLLSGVIYARTR